MKLKQKIEKISIDTQSSFRQEKYNERFVVFCVCCTILGLASLVGIFWGKEGYITLFWGKEGYITLGLGIFGFIVLIMWFGFLKPLGETLQ